MGHQQEGQLYGAAAGGAAVWGGSSRGGQYGGQQLYGHQEGVQQGGALPLWLALTNKHSQIY